ncbi:hypothetical protein B1773_00365 [Dehalococcoides mccartyi]|uniref:hypothetical protein n=1 Tax=Dehalococcoides mccartyi TaxID=61435 RepID=UPI00098FCAB9|nr:hypothetical protein [Dehalococcoides mccartyi]AQU02552.1 hypothetical protein B1773_00365 [Dehalococcoides mccartyi]
MKKLLVSVIPFILVAITGAVPIMASTITDAIYMADIRATNASYTAQQVSVPFIWSSQSLLDGYYIDPDFSNLALRDSGGLDIPFMPGYGSNPWMMWVEQISQNSAINYNLYTGGETAMGGKLAYFPGTAGMSVVDSATLELGNDFEIELSGRFNDGYNLSKFGAFWIYTSGTDVSAGNSSSYTETPYNGTAYSATSMYGANWIAQTFQFSNDVAVNQFTFRTQRVGNPTGNFNYAIYATSGDVPTGSALVSGSVVASTISTSAVNHTFDFSNIINLTAGTRYAIVLSLPNGDSSNKLTHWYNPTNPYANGRYCTTNNSGSSWSGTATTDINISITGNANNTIVTAADISSSEHVYKISLSAGTMNIYIDGLLEGSAAYAGSIIDNVNDWYFTQNGSMPYLYYAKITVGGVLKGSWEWQYATTFTDLSGNSNDATPSFRITTTDADVSVAVINYAACNQSAFIVGDDEDAVEIVTDDDLGTMPTGWYVNLHPENLPGGQQITDFLEEMNFPSAFLWLSLAFGGGAIITILSFGLTRKLLPCAVAGLIWQVFWCATIGVPWWVLVPVAVVIIGEMTNRKLASY